MTFLYKELVLLLVDLWEIKDQEMSPDSFCHMVADLVGPFQDPDL